ncbi:MAG: DUF2062 domain-containing protein [Desulfuromonadales bacterium]|jgi:hypothetical protein
MKESDPQDRTVRRFAWPGQTRCRELWRRLIGQGLAPHRMSLAIALGATIGVLPTIWGTSLICFCCAWLFGLNQVAVQAVNYLVYPLQIALFLPFAMCGQKLFPGCFGDGDLLSVGILQSGWSSIDDSLLATQFSALTGWVLSTPFIASTVYLAVFSLCKVLRYQQSSAAKAFSR